MKKNNKNGAFTWAVVFAWVFGIVGVAGVMYMLFTNEDYNGMGGEKFDSSYIAKTDANKIDSEKKEEGMVPKVADNTPKTPVKKLPPPVVIPPVKPIEKAPVVKVAPPVVKPTPPVVKPTPPVVKPAPPVVKVTPPVVKPTPPVVKPTPPIVKPTPPVVKVVPPIVKPKAPPVVIPKPSKPRPDKVMTDGELEQLVKNIEQKGDENGIYAKCVQLHSTSGTNNKGAVQQIESYLRSKKYSIAGRETTSSSVNGIKIAAGNGCLKVTVGSL